MSEERILRRLRGDGGQKAAMTDTLGGDPVFSYLWDMPAVYAAFLAEYRVDLLVAKMHLWQFDALFAALPEDCMLRRTMALRAMPMDAAADDDARAALAAQKLAVRIPAGDILFGDVFGANGSTFCCSFAKQKKTGEGLSSAADGLWAEDACGGDHRGAIVTSSDPNTNDHGFEEV